MPSGSLLAVAALAGQAGPLPGVTVTVLDESGLPAARLVTDENGRTAEADLPAPDRAYSLAEGNTAVRPYAVYTLLAEKDGWQSVEIRGVQVFDGQQTVARLALLPADPVLQTARLLAGSQVEIPPHPLYAGAGGSGPAPVYECAVPQVLDEVVIPRTITVHLGRPAENARNVTVPFQEYIANVASSEVYPTWEGYRNSQKARQSIISLPSIRQLSHSPTKNRIIDPYRAIALPPGRFLKSVGPGGIVLFCLLQSHFEGGTLYDSIRSQTTCPFPLLPHLSPVSQQNR